jgi:CRP-like cAMP-binding protein
MLNIESSNALLAALPLEDYKRISADLTYEQVTVRQALQKRDEPLHDVYFPSRSLCSVIMTTADGAEAEVAALGCEGVVGVEALLGFNVAICDAVIQIAGDGICHSMRLDTFRRELDRRGAFESILRKYANAFVVSLMQSVACSAVHSADARCCRWLLQAHDRIGSDQFPLTHDLLSRVIGVRRPTVTLIMSDLVRRRAIATTRGVTRIIERATLEERSCECYRVVKAQLFGRSLPSNVPKPLPGSGPAEHELVQEEIVKAC